MATYRLKRPKLPLMQTHTFDYYNQAVAFMRNTAPILKPSKPYRRTSADRSVWCVTLAGMARYADKATYKKIVENA